MLRFFGGEGICTHLIRLEGLWWSGGGVLWVIRSGCGYEMGGGMRREGGTYSVGRRHCGYASLRRMGFCLVRGGPPYCRSDTLREKNGGGGGGMTRMFMRGLSIFMFQKR